jgi:hypothetical protein
MLVGLALTIQIYLAFLEVSHRLIESCPKIHGVVHTSNMTLDAAHVIRVISWLCKQYIVDSSESSPSPYLIFCRRSSCYPIACTQRTI